MKENKWQCKRLLCVVSISEKRIFNKSHINICNFELKDQFSFIYKVWSTLPHGGFGLPQWVGPHYPILFITVDHTYYFKAEECAMNNLFFIVI